MSTMTTQGVLVTLTGTDNTYLKPELPVRGRLHIIECGTDGSIITATFRREKESGGFFVPVEVRNPRFTYGEPLAAEHYQHAAHHLTQATAIDKTLRETSRVDTDVSITDRFERHTRLAELHLAMAQARTADIEEGNR